MRDDASSGGRAGSARTPRYEEIHRALAADIRSGRYAVGSKLPPELQLCDTFGASRHTVREAIRRLSDKGLIARRAGSGTVVLRRTRGTTFTQQISGLPDLITYVKSARLEVLDARDIRADADVARLLKCRRGEAWHRLTALKHLKGGRRPVAYLHAYVHRDHPALRGVLDRGGVGLHEFIEEKIGHPIAAVEQQFAAKPLRGREAKALAVVPGYAGFVIVRRYRAAPGRTVLVTSTVFPYDRMNYSMTLKLE